MARLPAKTAVKKYEKLLAKRQETVEQLLPARYQGQARPIRARRFVTACTLAAYRNPTILQCTPESQVRAALCAVVLDLLPDVLGHGYFVPFRDHKSGKYQLQWITGYQGMVELAHRSGLVRKIETHLVYDGEKFAIRYGTNPGIEHVPNVDGPPEPAEKRNVSCESLHIVGAYAVATFNSGETTFNYMAASQLDAIRKRTRARSGPWFNWPDVLEMYRKCPLRRLAKLIPQTPALHLALGMDDAAEQGKPQIIEAFGAIEGPPVAEPPAEAEATPEPPPEPAPPEEPEPQPEPEAQTPPLPPKEWPRGWTPDKVLAGKSKYRGRKLREVPNAYLDSLVEKGAGTYKKAALAELARREQVGLFISPEQCPPTQNAKKQPEPPAEPKAPAEPEPTPPGELADEDIPFGGPPETAANAAPAWCPKCKRALARCTNPRYYLCWLCGRQVAAELALKDKPE